MKSSKPLILLIVSCVIILTVVPLGGAPVSAQDTPIPTSTFTPTPLTCQAVLPLIASHLNSCGAMEKDQVCLGNGSVTVDYTDPANTPKFIAPGDTAPVRAFKTIVNSPLDLTTGQWGVTVFKAQAVAAGVTTGQVVTFVMYGDTNLTNLTPPDNTPPTATSAPMTCTGTTKRLTYLRGTPVYNGPQVKPLPGGTAVTIRGRTPDNQWVFGETGGLTGWVFTSTLNMSCDLGGIPVVTTAAPGGGGSPGAPAELPAIRAFYFSTGVGETACNDLPSSGLLIQSPSGQKVTFDADGVNITIGSTVVLRAQPNQFLGITVLTGSATLSSGGITQMAYPGQRIRVGLGGDNGLTPVGKLGAPTFLNTDDMDLQTVCQVGKAIGLDVPCRLPAPPKAATRVLTATPVPSPVPAQTCTFTVQRFSASPNPVGPGQSTTLYWDVEGIQTVAINGQGVVGHGSMVLKLRQTTTFTMTMTCGGQQQARSLTITVNPSSVG
ncbi:MAG TPA: SH3 domain-containing protein [Aggregatilineales bacterium]|nr:SH3 domain-containing protein [Aggregatilineales bacterium]